MRVCISAFVFTTAPGKRFAGVGRNMASNLAEICRKDRGVQFDVYVKDDVEIPHEWRCDWVRWHPISVKSVAHRLFWEHFWIGRVAARNGADLVHSLFANVPFGCMIPITTLIHDAFPRTHSDWYTPRGRLILDWMTATGCKYAKRVATVSVFSMRELARAYGVQEEKFDVVFNGPGNDIQSLTADELAGIPTEGLPDLSVPFVFTVSTLEPRKNLKGLISAMEAVPDMNLLVAGAKGWLESDLASFVDASPAKDRIHFLGYVTDEQLNLLMNRCSLFALVSHVEGFGIPVLEAMLAGAPVVTSRTSSLPEVAGEWAYYCDPSDPSSITRAILEAMGNDVERARRASGGKEYALRFSWEASVDKLVDMFRKAVGR